jgi:two-component system, NarL family, sensor histidine kinase BarA
MLAPVAHEKNLQLISYVDSSIPRTLLGDSLRFKQVLANLINNAIKFSTKGNIIVRVKTIATQETHLMLKVSISDQGQGLTQHQKNDLFKAFSQVDSSNSRAHGGAGLGLAICKGLVERMNGEIGVESQAEVGSIFWFTARLGIDKNQSDTLLTPHLNNHRVLVCGSNPDSLTHIQSMLSEWRLEQQSITEIHDIFPIIRQAKNSGSFEILILDIAPDEKKIPPALLNNISIQLQDEFSCKVIVCCSASHQRQFRSGDNNSKTHFVQKPITYDALLKMLCAQLGISLVDMSYKKETLAADDKPCASVLLVDDNPANLQLTSELLRGLNTAVVQASNGLQAIEACKHNKFDLVFMDIQMPGMDGYEATQKIRKNELHLQRTPIIALTAHSITDQKSQLLISGMDDCLSKPVSEAQLANIINRWASLSGKKEVIIQEDFTPSRDKKITKKKLTEENSSVDIQLCLKLANKKPALARDMLAMMLTGLPKEQADINQAVADNNIDSLSELIHRLYGSSCYCGVPRLKSISGLLDKLLQAQKMADARNAIASLNSAIDDILLWGKDRDLDAAFGLQKEIEM